MRGELKWAKIKGDHLRGENFWEKSCGKVYDCVSVFQFVYLSASLYSEINFKVNKY